jgi:hypothetical protein
VLVILTMKNGINVYYFPHISMNCAAYSYLKSANQPVCNYALMQASLNA